MLFHCIRKAVSCLGRQLLGDSLLPVWPMNKKIKISDFKPDPPITALCFCVPLLLPKRRLLRRNRVADVKKVFFPHNILLSRPATLHDRTFHLRQDLVTQDRATRRLPQSVVGYKFS